VSSARAAICGLAFLSAASLGAALVVAAASMPPGPTGSPGSAETKRDRVRPRGEGEATLSYRTNLRSGGEFSVHVKDGQISTGGKALPRPAILALASELRMAFSRNPELTLPQKCPAGEFIHEVRQGRRKMHETGCMTDRRFSVLLLSFQRLQTAAWR
jgi:hypothetical protein